MLSVDALVIKVEADRIMQLSQQQFDQYFDNSDGDNAPILANLYAKAGNLSVDIIGVVDELHACLTLIEEIKKSAEIS